MNAGSVVGEGQAVGDVLVVGGGPAGLATALLAARRGVRVTLVEASARLGGMAASIEVAGQRVDLGSHRLHPSASAAVRALLDELLGDDLQVRTRHGRLRVDDRWAAFPLDPADLVRSLPTGLAMRIAADLFLGAARPTPDVSAGSYADVVRQRLGRTVLERFHGPYARKLYGVDPATIDGDVARRRIALTGLGDVLGRLRRTRRAGGKTFLYPRLGYGQVVDRLAQACSAAGVDVHTSTTVTALTPGTDGAGAVLSPTDRVQAHADGVADARERRQPSDRVRERAERVADARDREGPSDRVQVARVLWTAPPGALATAVGRPAPTLEHRGLALVYLVVERDRWLAWDAHYVPTPGVPFVRLSEPRNYRDGPDPDGVTVLCAELPCTVGDATWTASDADLRDAVVDGIARLDLPVPAVADHHVVRLPRVYPLLRVGEAAALAAALHDLDAIPGVTLLGRQGLGVADNLHHVLDMAHAAAACLAPDGAWDGAAWAHHRAAFDDHVVED